MTSQFIPKPGSSSLGSKGFTLVELAVVLIILGAIFMSVLKVESMVKNAKIRQVINQYRELRAAILVYKDKYGYLPGDDPKANIHVGTVYVSVSEIGGNGRIELLANSGKQEYAYLFGQLGAAGLIKGNYDGTVRSSTPYTFYPVQILFHAFDGPVFVCYNEFVSAPLKVGNCLRIEDLPVDVAQSIDTILDDGDPTNGFIRAATQGAPDASRGLVGSNNYTTGALRTLVVYFE